MQETEKELKFLKLLSKSYLTIGDVCREIINLQAILDLPKGTEHFMSDLHGEHEAFTHILNNASGEIREKIDMVFGHTVSAQERASFATLIYYPEQKLDEIKDSCVDIKDWYVITLYRLIELCVVVSSKYTRSKVRKALPKDFEYIIDELLHTNYAIRNKEVYYHKIISTIIQIDRADAFIVALATLIKRLVVDHLHIVGDIYDRGARPDVIVDKLMKHHNVDVQWGNHDILWMGAGAGNKTCIANVIHISLQYNHLEFIENGYGISLRKMVTFAQETYTNCTCFAPKLSDDAALTQKNIAYISQLHKAIVVIQFKLEGQSILRHPEYHMQDRLLLDKLDLTKAEVTVDGVTYPIRDTDFPTIDPQNPYALTPQEEELMEELQLAFTSSEKLQTHIQFLLTHGSLYKCYNANLLFHGCIPLEEDGTFTRFIYGDREYSGKSYMDFCDRTVRNAFHLSDTAPDKELATDFFWFLWAGKGSPLFGRHKMATFERYLLADKSTWEEKKNPYYALTNDENVCKRILREFGLCDENSHIINGHMPVKSKDGENPIKANGRLIVIDGGFCRAYQPTTGIAGYTLIYNSWGLKLVSHEAFSTMEEAIRANKDILSTSRVFEMAANRLYVSDTDIGKDLQERVADLEWLLRAYREGLIQN